MAADWMYVWLPRHCPQDILKSLKLELKTPPQIRCFLSHSHIWIAFFFSILPLVANGSLLPSRHTHAAILCWHDVGHEAQLTVIVGYNNGSGLRVYEPSSSHIVYQYSCHPMLTFELSITRQKLRLMISSIIKLMEKITRILYSCGQ